MGEVAEAPRPGRDLAHAVHAAGVAVPAALDDHGHVDIGDVALAQLTVAGDAMADHVVGRDAHGPSVALIAEAGGQGAVVEDELAGQVVQPFGRDARDHLGDQHVEAFRGQPACAAHAFEAFRTVHLDLVRADRPLGDAGFVHR